MASKSKDKKPFEKAWSLEIEGDVQHFCPIVERVAREISIDNFVFKACQDTSKVKTSFAWFNIFMINRTTAYQRLLGVLTLESPGSNRTILRVPPRSQWGSDGLYGDDLVNMGLSEQDDDDIQCFNRYFMIFIDDLDTTLKNYGVKVTRLKRLWRGFKELIGIINALKP